MKHPRMENEGVRLHSEGRRLRVEGNAWMQHGSVVETREEDGVVVLCVEEGAEEEAYLKVFNPFGRVSGLFVFQEGHWVDAHSGRPPESFVLSFSGSAWQAEREPAPAAVDLATRADAAPVAQPQEQRTPKKRTAPVRRAPRKRTQRKTPSGTQRA